MNAPARYDFITQLQRDGLRPFTITLTYASGDPVDLTGAQVKMQMRDPALDRLVYEFSSEGEGERLLTLPGNGVIQFPQILTWKLTPAAYQYELQVTEADGFIRTYLKGTWSIKKHITK